MSDEDVLRDYAVKIAVITERLTHYEQGAAELEEDLRKLAKHVVELKSAVAVLKSGRKDDSPVFFGMSAGSLRDKAAWISVFLVILYSMGADIPTEALVDLLKSIGKG